MEPSKILKQLRRYIDGNDPFINKGHEIKKIRRPYKEVPEWVSDNSRFQKTLLRAFPLLKTDEKQRERAGRWARIAILYYQKQHPRTEIAEETGLTYDQVNTLIRSIKRVAYNQRANGSGARKRKRT